VNVITLNAARASALGSECVDRKVPSRIARLVVLRFSCKSIRASLCTFVLASQLMHACVSMKGTLSTLRRLQRLSARDLPPREDGTNTTTLHEGRGDGNHSSMPTRSAEKCRATRWRTTVRVEK